MLSGDNAKLVIALVAIISILTFAIIIYTSIKG